MSPHWFHRPEEHSAPHEYVTTTEDLHDLLKVVLDHAEAQYSADPTKLAQLQSAMGTAHMVIDQLVERNGTDPHIQ